MEERAIQSETRKRSRLESESLLLAEKGTDADQTLICPGKKHKPISTQHDHYDEDKEKVLALVVPDSTSSPVWISEAHGGEIDEAVSIDDSDEDKVRKALQRTRELSIADYKVMPVLMKLLKETDGNWSYIKLDNYIALVDAVLSIDEEKKQSEGSSNGNRGKNLKVIDRPATLKKNYETRSATSGSSNRVVQKQPQLSNGNRKRKFNNRISDITKGSESVEISLLDDVGSEDVPKFTYIPHNIVYQSAYVC